MLSKYEMTTLNDDVNAWLIDEKRWFCVVLQFPAPMQAREEIVNTGNFQGGQPISTLAGHHHPFSETHAEPMRIVEDSKAVPSWDVAQHPDWALPTPPPAPASAAMAIPPHQAANNNNNNSNNVNSNLLPPPPPGSVPPAQEFVSPAAYNGSFQKLPNAPYAWAPLNTLMHTTAKLQFDSPQGRGRQPLPVVSHNVNGATSGMMMPSADHVVNDDTVSSSFNQAQAQAHAAAAAAQAQQFNWPHHGINVHHNVANSPQGNVPSSWNASVGYNQQQQPPPPSSWRPASAPASPLPPPPPLPSFLAQQHNSSNQYWQPQLEPSSFRPAPPLPFRPQDCRPPRAQWHLNGSNYHGPNR